MLKTFELFYKTYRVEVSDDIIGDRAQVDPDNAVVYINRCVPEDERESLTYHELVHAILCEMGRDDLYDDEKFVTPFASALYQAILTMK